MTRKITRPIPKTLEICNITVSVIYDENYMLKVNSREGRNDASGYTLIDEQEIVIDPTVGPDIQDDTLLHEVMHWAFYLAGGREIFGPKKEEKFICLVTSILLDSLKRNPALRERLFGDSIVDTTT